MFAGEKVSRRPSSSRRRSQARSTVATAGWHPGAESLPLKCPRRWVPASARAHATDVLLSNRPRERVRDGATFLRQLQTYIFTQQRRTCVAPGAPKRHQTSSHGGGDGRAQLRAEIALDGRCGRRQWCAEFTMQGDKFCVQRGQLLEAAVLELQERRRELNTCQRIAADVYE